MANLLEGETKVTGDVKVGNVTAPPAISGGTGAMSTSNKANGSVHLRTDDDTLPEVLHNDAVAKLGLSGHDRELDVGDLTANAATTKISYMPRDAIITGVSRRFTVVPNSTAGTVVTGITVGGNQILASASEDEEGVSNDTLTAYNLTATTADLTVSEGDKIILTCTSNNADMTGGTDMMAYIRYDDN